jgi:CubicO group peptidase (beta-lactamase class C family)
VGRYDYADGATAELIAGDALFAVIDEAKYRLRRVGPYVFVNAGGDTIPFRHDGRGAVIGFVERGTFRRRRSPQVSAGAAALAHPRPPGGPAYRYRPPADRHDGIAVGDIARTPLGVATAERLVAGVLDGTWPDVHAVLLYHGGRLVLEEYFHGYGPERPHQLRSATKSVVSALVGAAVARGALRGVDEPVLPRLPYGGPAAYAHPDPRKARLTLGDLLTMRPGLACDDHDDRSPGRETVLYAAPDWVKATLDLPMAHDPGTEAHYCSGAVAVTGRIVERAVGAALPAFADTALFRPLGIAPGTWRWHYPLTNADREYAQLHLRPRDLLKLGLLYANDGRWQGRPVLPAAWVAASLAAQTPLENTGYGYYWWRPWLSVQTPAGATRVTFNAAQGNGGQKLYLVPQHDLVAVFTGGAYNVGNSPPNAMMARVILPPLVARTAARPAP